MKCIDCAAFEYVGDCPHCGEAIFTCGDGNASIIIDPNIDECDGIWEE